MLPSPRSSRVIQPNELGLALRTRVSKVSSVPLLSRIIGQVMDLIITTTVNNSLTKDQCRTALALLLLKLYSPNNYIPRFIKENNFQLWLSNVFTRIGKINDEDIEKIRTELTLKCPDFCEPNLE